MRQLGVIRDKQAFSAAEVAREEYFFVVLAQECFCLFCVYPKWPLKYPMVLCSLRDSELAYLDFCYLEASRYCECMLLYM